MATLMKKKPAKLAHVDDYPALSEAMAKWNELHAKRQALTATIATLSDSVTMDAEQAVVAAEVASLLGEDSEAAEQSRLQEALAVARRSLVAVDIAIKQFAPALEAARKAASRAVCASRVDEHIEHAERIAKALIELQTALQAEEKFRADLHASGADFVGPLQPVFFNRLGNTNEGWQTVSNWFAGLEYPIKTKLG